MRIDRSEPRLLLPSDSPAQSELAEAVARLLLAAVRLRARRAAVTSTAAPTANGKEASR